MCLQPKSGGGVGGGISGTQLAYSIWPICDSAKVDKPHHGKDSKPDVGYTYHGEDNTPTEGHFDHGEDIEPKVEYQDQEKYRELQEEEASYEDLLPLEPTSEPVICSNLFAELHEKYGEGA